MTSRRVPYPKLLYELQLHLNSLCNFIDQHFVSIGYLFVTFTKYYGCKNFFRTRYAKFFLLLIEKTSYLCGTSHFFLEVFNWKCIFNLRALELYQRGKCFSRSYEREILAVSDSGENKKFSY